MAKGASVERSAGVLLCEACGYPLTSAEEGALCPECGREAALSDPSRRVGSRWQRRGTAGALLWSGAALLARPRRFWDRVEVSLVKGRAMAALYALAAGVAGSSPAVLYRGWGVLPMLIVGSAALVYLLTWVETAGIRFWGRVHGFRVTPAVAWSICGHASVGWLVGGVLAAAGWIGGQAYSESSHRVYAFGGYLALAPVAAPVLIAVGGAIGMLVFETLTYLGVRRMRFANAPGASALHAAD